MLGAVRRAKTTAKRSMRAQVARLTVTDTAARLDALDGRGRRARRRRGGRLVTAVGDVPSVEVELAEEY